MTVACHPAIEDFRLYLGGSDIHCEDQIRAHVFECHYCAELLAALRMTQWLGTARYGNGERQVAPD
jgi:hypothetical protein